MYRLIKTVTLILPFTLLFTGCGDNFDDNSYATQYYPTYPLQQGHFVDSGVKGMTYTKSNGNIRETGSGGSFNYYLTETVSFSIGNLIIGKSLALSIVTPKDIVAFQNLELNTSIYSPEVNNRVRLLMSLDDDANPANGIDINNTTQADAKNWTTPLYDMNATQFNDAVDIATNGDVNISSISADDASAHFASSLRCVYSGAYSGNWILPGGNRDGFVGVMIQSDGTIVTLGDGQDLDGDDNYTEYLFARGTHYMDDGYYDFNETGEFNATSGSIVPSSKIVKGDGESVTYDRVVGSFEQTNPDTNETETGSYEASRVGNGSNVSYRYTGYGFGLDGDSNSSNDPILGLFTFDISRDGSVVGLIHDARNNLEPPLKGQVIFHSDNNASIDMNLTYPNNGGNYAISGTLAQDGTVNLDWKDDSNTTLGYIGGVGCQLQTHD